MSNQNAATVAPLAASLATTDCPVLVAFRAWLAGAALTDLVNDLAKQGRKIRRPVLKRTFVQLAGSWDGYHELRRYGAGPRGFVVQK